MTQDRPNAISKILSRNDTGETGAHQVGILIPKAPNILAFFPNLNPREMNPRHHITFTDEFGEPWTFAFIYYNNALFGGTRNEYRLTRMTAFISGHNLHAGDTIILRRSESAAYTIAGDRLRQPHRQKSGRLILGSSWKIVGI
jgi:hypothetical protein